MKTKKLLSVFLAFAMIISLMPTLTLSAKAGSIGYWSSYTESLTPSGTVYMVSTPGQLAYVATLINNDTNTYSGITIELGSDINLSGHLWVPMGSSAYPFTGNFNGNGHSISGLLINDTMTYAGLFGMTNGNNSEIKDVSITNVELSATSTDKCVAGALAGYAGGCTVSGCSSTGTITAHGTNMSVAGGLLGDIEAESVVTGCSSTADVNGNVRAASNAYLYFGGLVGTANDATIKSSYASGNVTVNSSTCSPCAGGLIGDLVSSNISKSYAKGSVTGYFACGGGLVGTVGTSGSYISNCYARGDLLSSTEISHVGGLIGTTCSNGVEGSYSTGIARGVEGDVLGGFAGSYSSFAAVTNVYYNSLNDNAVIAGLAGKSATDMQTSVFATTLNSTQYPAVWTQSSTTNDGYPVINGVGDGYVASYSVSGTVSSGSTGYSVLNGVTVNLYASTDSSYGTVIKSGITIDGGAYTISGVPNGTYVAVVAAKSGKYALSASSQFTVSGVTTDADITLQEEAPSSYSLNGNVSAGSTNASVNGITIYLYNPNTGEPIVSGGSPITSVADTNGDYSFSGLSAGDYILLIPLVDGTYNRLTYYLTVVGSEASITCNLTLDKWTNSWNNYFNLKKPDYESGTKTYTIDNAAELAWVAFRADTNTFQGDTLKLGDNINLSDHLWRPISNFVNFTSFAGTFDGNGHTITGLTINENTESAAPTYAGMFGYINNATIKNVRLENISITDTGNTSDLYAGGLFGYDDQGSTITGCYTTGSITVGGSNSVKAGGLIGYLNSNTGANNITDSHSACSVSIVSGSTVMAGGLIGHDRLDDGINGCYSSGAISAVGDTGVAGGFIGYAEYHGLGAAVTISNCYSTSNVILQIQDGYAGGLVGQLEGISIGSSYSTGSITAGSTTNIAKAGGGLVGAMTKGSYTAMFFTNNVGNSLKKSYSTGVLNGYFTTGGGLIGSINDDSTYCSVENCYAMGNVTDSSPSETGAGGLIGNTVSSNVTHCYSAGTASGAQDIGGYAGTDTSGTAISSVYYNSENSSAGKDASGAAAMTAAEMKTSTFATTLNGSQSTAPWTRSAAANSGYPVLSGVGDGASYTVSGIVSSGSTGYSVLNGITVNLYASTDTTYSAPQYTATTGTGGAFSLDMANGTYVAVVAKASGKYAVSVSAPFTVSGAAVTDANITLQKEVPSVSAVKPSGTGNDADNPYLVATAGNLLWISQNSTAQSGFSGKYFKQTANIDLTGLDEFTPIGSMTNPFKGHYDGDNSEISNLYIHGSYQETGLFGDLKGGTIDNLTLEDVSISGNNWAVAGLVGYLESTGTVTNCHITKSSAGSSSIEVTYLSGGSAIGGIAGENDGTIEYCSNAADIINHRSYAAGGIAGGSYTSGSAGIYNCYNSGAITGSAGIDPLGTITGGIAGDLSGTISHCYNIGTVTVGRLNNVGGIVGGISRGSALGNYYLATSADNGIGNDVPGTSSTGAAAKTSTQLKTASTFENWNFTTAPLCWVIDESINSGYPYISVKQTHEELDSADVATAKAALDKADFTLGNPDTDITAITTNFTLPASGSSGTIITWSEITDTNSCVSLSGDTATVTRPTSTQGDTTVTVRATITKGAARETKDFEFIIKAKSAGGSDSGGSSYSSSSTTGDSAQVKVNGVSQSVGTSSATTNSDGQKVTTVTVDTDKLKTILDGQSNGATVTIPVTSGSSIASGVLTGTMVKTMETKSATLEIQTDSATYTVPASEINIDAVSQQLGANVSLSDITVKVSVAEPTNAMAKVVAEAAGNGGFTVEVPAVEFTISCTYSEKTISVSSFNSYVERLISIPSGVDASKITTAIVVEADGSVHHVPTEITVIDGKYYAKVNSLTNRVYSLI